MSWKENLKNQFFACEAFIRFVLKHFIQDDCPYIASALAFTSLLGLVPLMAVSLAAFSTFSALQEFSEPIQNFIFANFVPTTGKIIQTYLQQFTSQVSKLSVWGILFLTITALLMLFTIERAMNKIWRVTSSRHGIASFLLYWAILSLAPILIGLSLAISSYLFSITLLFEDYTFTLLLQYAPFFLSLAGFVFLYTIVPNCPVKIRHAFWGGLVASVLFEMAKYAFAYYLLYYNTYALLYGAFAIVPVFFIWIYWMWIITLLGAEIGYALSVRHKRREGQLLDGFSHSLLWLYELWTAQQKGKGVTFNELIGVSNQPFAVDAKEMINELIHRELIHYTAEGQYMLSRDLNQISLYDLSQQLPYRLPNQLELNNLPQALSQWNTIFNKNNIELQKNFNIKLSELFKIN